MALHFDKQVEKNEFELIPNGEYEVTLNAEWKTTRNGDQFINCTFKIRKDVEQDFGGRLVFDGIYKTRANGEFQTSKINGILSAIPNARQDFESYDDLIQYINDQNMIIEIETQKADPTYAGSKDKNIVKYLSYKPSNVGTQATPNATTETTTKVMQEEEATDLPF